HHHYYFPITPPPPPSSTLFPYTTLFRSNASRSLTRPWSSSRNDKYQCMSCPLPTPRSSTTSSRKKKRLADSSTPHVEKSRVPSRSEEHTSELQSLAYLVCRLLLEKKKEN